MEQTQTFTIYFQLEQGAKADLEVVSRSAIEFTKAVKELAFFLDPTLDLRVELITGTESSLSLNSLFRVIKAGVHPKVLQGVTWGALSFLGYVGMDVYNHSSIHTYIQGHPDGQLSDADIQRLAAEIAKGRTAEPVRTHVQEFYRQVEADKAVTGVGASLKPGQKPSVIVPRSQFRAMSGVGEVIETTEEARERITLETLILVAPVLQESGRKWRFRSGTGEFGAAIDDQQFLADVLSGRRQVHMISGIQMDVELKTLEEKTPEGLWKPVDRHIVRVIDMREPPFQGSMDFSGGQP